MVAASLLVSPGSSKLDMGFHSSSAGWIPQWRHACNERGLVGCSRGLGASTPSEVCSRISSMLTVLDVVVVDLSCFLIVFSQSSGSTAFTNALISYAVPRSTSRSASLQSLMLSPLSMLSGNSALSTTTSAMPLREFVSPVRTILPPSSSSSPSNF